MSNASGPLLGTRVLEFAGIGPGPYAGTLLSDFGADVVRIVRKGSPDPLPTRFDARNRRTIELDLKVDTDVAVALALADRAELVIEGNRPGVMEKLGLGPEPMHMRNPSLVYGRMTGWGQGGPLAASAGHDINFLAITGALHAIGTPEKPLAPLNLAADFGGGAMFLVAGLLAALLHARSTGKGQVVDVAMSDCAAYTMSLFYGHLATNTWEDSRGTNLLDGGAPFYDTFRCSDDKWVAVGALEPQFYELLIEKLGITELSGDQMDKSTWASRKEIMQKAFLTRTRDEWCALMEGIDACLTPVLAMSEAPAHPHNLARQTFTRVGGALLPAPAPRFSQTPASVQWPPAPITDDLESIFGNWGAKQPLPPTPL